MVNSEPLEQKAQAYRALAREAYDLAQQYVEFKDDSPTGFAISNGELYHAHLRSAQRFEGMAAGIDIAIDFIREVETA